jgi:hypothetical protein
MSMRLRDKFPLFAVLRTAAGGLFLMLVAAFAVAAAGMSPPSAGTAALSPTFFIFEQSDLGEGRLPRGAIPRAPERAPTCFDRHYPCGPGGIATAHAEAVYPGAMLDAGLVKAPALLPAPIRYVAPHPAASLSILFRNFRE